MDTDGEPVYLADIWPTDQEITALVKKHVKQEFYKTQYGRIFDGDEFWHALDIKESTTYAWDPASTYIKKPPYFDGFNLETTTPGNIENARPFLLLGDSVTTDHISPAGAIPKDYPAGKYLIGQGVDPAQFNSYGARRGNHEVMMRGTFGNIRIKNQLVGSKEGAWTIKFPEGEETFNYDAAMQYMQEKIPLVVLGGKEYGTGSSRDWAAKGTNLLGIKAVITQSYERIHRNNLVGMGALPLVFADGESAQSLGLDGSETFTISGVAGMTPRKQLAVKAVKADGSEIKFSVTSRLDTEVDVEYFENGGILPCVIRKMMAAQQARTQVQVHQCGPVAQVEKHLFQVIKQHRPVGPFECFLLPAQRFPPVFHFRRTIENRLHGPVAQEHGADHRPYRPHAAMAAQIDASVAVVNPAQHRLQSVQLSRISVQYVDHRVGEKSDDAVFGTTRAHPAPIAGLGAHLSEVPVQELIHRMPELHVFADGLDEIRTPCAVKPQQSAPDHG
jgi:hypothetical protein